MTRPHSPTENASSGFTLMELAVGLTVLGILLPLVVGTCRFTLAALNDVKVRADALRECNFVLSTLACDLGSAERIRAQNGQLRLTLAAQPGRAASQQVRYERDDEGHLWRVELDAHRKTHVAAGVESFDPQDLDSQAVLVELTVATGDCRRRLRIVGSEP